MPPIILTGAMIPNNWPTDDHTVPDRCGIRQILLESTPVHVTLDKNLKNGFLYILHPRSDVAFKIL